MSYILDALKRSEEERNRGHVPTLQTVYYENDDRSLEFLHTTTGRLLLAALLIAIAALVYSNRQPVISAYDRFFGNPSPAVTETQVVQPAQTDTSTQVIEPAQSAQTQQPEPAIAGIAQVPRSEPTAAPPAQPQATHSAVTGTAASAEQAAGAEVGQLAESQSVQPVPGPAPVQTATIVDQNTESDAGRRKVKTKHDLPADVKRSIPKLALSVVSYAADPQKRFVMVESEIYYEGEEMTENLIIESITPDGPIVTWRGQFRLALFRRLPGLLPNHRYSISWPAR